VALIKPIDQLTRDDLEDFPLWEFATDVEGDFDETAVRPVAADWVPREAHQVYTVACDVRTASGRMLLGHLGVVDGEMDGEAPTLVTDTHGSFGLDERPHRRIRAAWDALLGGEYEAHFPVHWRLRLPIAGELAPREGTFDGR
jgi:hypothetical protein